MRGKKPHNNRHEEWRQRHSEGFIMIPDPEKERICGLEDRSVEITQTERQTEKKKPKRLKINKKQK